MESPKHPEKSIFQRTNPSELKRARAGDIEALDALVRRYHSPLRVYLCYLFPKLSDRAEELLQDFAEDRFIRQGWLEQVDLRRGRFRDFLKTSLRNFVLNWIQKNRRESRFEHFDTRNEEDLAPSLATTPAQDQAANDAYDLELLRAIVAETLRRMEQDCQHPDKQQTRRAQAWEIFNLRVLKPALEDIPPPPFHELAKRFALRSPTDGSNLLLTAKRMFERHLFEVVAEYQNRDEPVSVEVEELKKALLRLTEPRKSS